MTNPAIEDIKNYLTISARMREDNFPQREDWVYTSYEAYVLDNGQEFTLYGKPLKQMTPKACFHNARLKAMAFPHKYRYVEGWATSLIAVQHAWVIDPEDRVIDPTWGHRIGAGYFGVVFDYEDVLDAVRTSQDGFSMLYPVSQRHPLLTHGRQRVEAA